MKWRRRIICNLTVICATTAIGIVATIFGSFNGLRHWVTAIKMRAVIDAKMSEFTEIKRIITTKGVRVHNAIRLNFFYLI